MMPNLEHRFVIQAIHGQSQIRVFEWVDGKREEVHAFRMQDPITTEKDLEIVKTLCDAMKKAGLIEEGEPVAVQCTPSRSWPPDDTQCSPASRPNCRVSRDAVRTKD